jgi:hypothetical protein
MKFLFECVQNLFRKCIVRSQPEHVTVPDNVELQENPAAEEPKNDLEDPSSDEDNEDIYADLPDLIPVVTEEYGTDEELEDLNSNQSDSEYRY